MKDMQQGVRSRSAGKGTEKRDKTMQVRHNYSPASPGEPPPPLSLPVRRHLALFLMSCLHPQQHIKTLQLAASILTDTLRIFGSV